MSAHRTTRTSRALSLSNPDVKKIGIYLAVLAAAVMVVASVSKSGVNGLTVLIPLVLLAALVFLITLLVRNSREKSAATYRRACGQVFCSVIGSSVNELRGARSVLVDFNRSGYVVIAGAGRDLWWTSYEDVSDVQIYGPGAVTTGGGYVGGGFGIGGAAVGILAAGALNSASQRTYVDTRVVITSSHGSVTLLTSEVTPMQLDLAIGNLVAVVRHQSAFGNSAGKLVARPVMGSRVPS